MFTSQLEKSRDTTSVGNLRSAYAEAQAAYLTEDKGNPNITITKSGGAITSVAVANVQLMGQQNGWSDAEKNLPKDVNWSAITTDTNGAVSGTKTITFTYPTTSTGTITATMS